jgi:hypothetical protein
VTDQIAHYQVPADISLIIGVVRQFLPFEERQIANLESQMDVVRSARTLTPQQKDVAYRQRLIPLMQQEDEIERERQNAHLEEKLKQIADR